MSTSLIPVPSDCLEELKTIAQTARSQLKAWGYELPGKRRFLDVFATGLGYSSFSHLATASGGFDENTDYLPDLIREAEQPLIESIRSACVRTKRDTVSNIRCALHAATPSADKVRQHLVVQIDEKRFYTKRYGLMECWEHPGQECISRYGLERTIIVALRVEGIPEGQVDWHRITSTIDVVKILEKSWRGEGYSFGRPAVLVVAESLAAEIPNLQDLCDFHGVLLESATGKNRKHTGLRVATRRDHAILETPGRPGAEDLSDLTRFFWDDFNGLAQKVLAANLRSTMKDRLISKRSGICGDVNLVSLSDKAIGKRKLPGECNTLLVKADDKNGIPEAIGIDADQLWTCSEEDDYWTMRELREDIDSVNHELLHSVKRCWAFDLSDYEHQRSLVIPSKRYPDWLFDYLYFECFSLSREPRFRLHQTMGFQVNRFSDFVWLAFYSMTPQEECTIVDIGNSTASPEYGYVLSIPGERGALDVHYIDGGHMMFYRVRRELIERWKHEEEDPSWYYWYELSEPMPEIGLEFDRYFEDAKRKGPLTGLGRNYGIEYRKARKKIDRIRRKADTLISCY